MLFSRRAMEWCTPSCAAAAPLMLRAAEPAYRIHMNEKYIIRRFSALQSFLLVVRGAPGIPLENLPSQGPKTIADACTPQQYTLLKWYCVCSVPQRGNLLVEISLADRCGRSICGAPSKVASYTSGSGITPPNMTNVPFRASVRLLDLRLPPEDAQQQLPIRARLVI